MDPKSLNMTSKRTKNSRIVLILILLSVISWGASRSIAQEQGESSPDKRKALAFVETAAGIARKMHSQSLVGYVAISVDQTNWAALLKDSDLGPFLIFKEQKPGRTAVILMSNVKAFMFCTYFDGSSPFGTVVLQPPGKRKITVGQIEASIRRFPPT
jgi:hypothetical protein